MEEQESDITLLLGYLHLEYGEEAGDKDALKASDLVYVGDDRRLFGIRKLFGIAVHRHDSNAATAKLCGLI